MNIVGRQPAIARITPSKPFPWYGGISQSTENEQGFRVGGEQFTREQQDAMPRHRVLRTITVRRLALHREAYWGLNERPMFEFDCPVVEERRDGRLLVIAPGGMTEIVEADGRVPEKTVKRFR